MKITGKILTLALVAAMGLSIATPARADWYDGHRHHHGHVPHGWIYNARLHYYVYQPAYVVAPPPPVGIVVAQPAPPPVVVTTPPQVVYAQPYYAAPAPPPPFGLNLGVHIR